MFRELRVGVPLKIQKSVKNKNVYYHENSFVLSSTIVLVYINDRITALKSKENRLDTKSSIYNPHIELWIYVPKKLHCVISTDWIVKIKFFIIILDEFRIVFKPSLKIFLKKQLQFYYNFQRCSYVCMDFQH